MTTPIEELLWQRVDGELPADRAVELAARLSADPEARQTAAGVEATARLLAGLSLVEPPAELRSRIDAALAGAGRPVVPLRRPARRLGWWRAAPLPSRLAYVAAGVVLGVAIGVFVEIRRSPTGEVDVRDLTGAMVPTKGSAVWPLDRGAGTLAAARLDGLLSLELTLTGAAPATFSLTGGGGLDLVHLAAPGGTPVAVEAAGGALTSPPLAAGRYRIEVRPAHPEAPIEMTVESGGSTVLRRTLRLADLPAI